ncbi:hypothetical protein COM24_32760 [Bacillus toyonensis]|nr:hypothetical protein CON80_29155 [Bacillus toyonensis]PFX35799.1 hypothetical protein COL24_29400 [Bacillus toyonensis]PFY19112.1 hypothetical protein COL44_26785 [Bacillus toyonensis]PGB06725.1 hypothetical protein COM09_32500 [Bacillus toyonensis]PGC12736.1 hypothetical protein COL99_13790 [Bacillus toyonensis]
MMDMYGHLLQVIKKIIKPILFTEINQLLKIRNWLISVHTILFYNKYIQIIKSIMYLKLYI